MMEAIKLIDLIEKLESGSREKGGSINAGIISIGGTQITNEGGFKWEKKEFVSEDFFLKMKSGKISEDDILIVKDGATTGKTSYVDKTFPYKEAAINEHVFRLQINQKRANPKYIFYFLHSPNGQMQILSDYRGATIGGISRGFVEKVEVPLPDIETQNKIVAVLDKANSLVRKKEETIVKYEELLRAAFLDMFGDPIVNPRGWEKMKLQELGTWRSGGTPSRSKPEYFKGDIPWYISGELNQMYISSSVEHISIPAVENSNAKIIESGSILIGMYDTAALKSSITTIEATCNQAISYAKINTDYCFTEYIYFAIQIGKDYFKSSQRGVRQQNLNLSMIKSIEVPIPPIELQAEFMRKLHKLESIKSKSYDGFNMLIILSEALSQLAFKGELTFNTAVDLEVLLENDYDFFKANSTPQSIRLLLDRLDKYELNDKKIYQEEVYQKAKTFIFGLLQEGIVTQTFDTNSNSVKLSLA